MASNVNFTELLDRKYPSYTVEVKAFLHSCSISNSVEVASHIIYNRIKDDASVDENLKLLYREAINGTDKAVKLRIKNRVTHFRRTLRPHPKVKELDMLHAADYGNMSFDQMNKKIEEAKKNDESVARAMQREQDHKRKAEEDIAAKIDASDDDVFAPDENESLKLKKPKNLQKHREAVLGFQESTMSLSNQDEHGLKVNFGQSGISKIACFTLGSAKATCSNDQGGHDEYAGPCSREFKCKEKEQKDVEAMNLDPTDFVFSHSALESEECGGQEKELKTYGAKEIPKGKKKLLPKKIPFINKLRYSKSSKAEMEFERIMKKDKDNRDKHLPLTSDEEPEKVSTDLKGAFNEKARRFELEDDEKVTLSRIRDCTSKVGKASVETTALMHALGDEKGLNVAKYHTEVEKELKEQAETDDSKKD